jgi:hypothetical protein
VLRPLALGTLTAASGRPRPRCAPTGTPSRRVPPSRWGPSGPRPRAQALSARTPPPMHAGDTAAANLPPSWKRPWAQMLGCTGLAEPELPTARAGGRGRPAPGGAAFGPAAGGLVFHANALRSRSQAWDVHGGACPCHGAPITRPDICRPWYFTQGLRLSSFCAKVRTYSMGLKSTNRNFRLLWCRRHGRFVARIL